MKLRDAVASYLRAVAAKRDAVRLIEYGFAAATKDPETAIREEMVHLMTRGFVNDVELTDANEGAILMVTLNEASYLLSVYGREPDSYPNGRSADLAMVTAEKAIRKRYARGRCSLCKGPALPCARRHAEGKSCA